jgi:hypothetical protein
VSISGSTYGSGTYGSGTYGQEASDPGGSQLRPVPWPGGGASQPAWQYVQGDSSPPFRCQIQQAGVPLPLNAVAAAFLVLNPIDSRDVFAASRFYPLTVESSDEGRLRRDWRHGDLLNATGLYRLAVVLQFLSGRLLTLPFGDEFSLFVGGSATVHDMDAT